ncbi:hypothetical protein N7465_004391 [Penicillium sp. CMV-2018d]|nr:hypothetical protein N7465_004391 [Penicillium sp. CMV-2018d]
MYFAAGCISQIHDGSSVFRCPKDFLLVTVLKADRDTQNQGSGPTIVAAVLIHPSAKVHGHLG